MKLLIVSLLALVLAVLGQQGCEASYGKCSECVVDSNCGWCSRTGKCWEGDSTGDTQKRCGDQYWIYAGRSAVLDQINSFPVNPTHFDVYLFPGDQLDLDVVVTNPETDDVPLDLYILEDVSGSMDDDVEKFGDLSNQLVIDVLTYQGNPRFGLGSFGDAPIPPFGEETKGNFAWPANYDMSNALTPCPTRTPTDGPFNWIYCHEMDLTRNYNDLQKTVRTLVTHVNGDWPESSMSALMLAAACDLGWRDGARKVVLVATDADWHAEIGGPYPSPNGSHPFTRANDYGCSLDAGANGLPGTMEDYPNTDVVKTMLANNNIIPIIASADAPPDHYDNAKWVKLINSWGFGKVFKLTSNSDNFIQIIRDALADLSTTMVLQKQIDQPCDDANAPCKGHVINLLPGGDDSTASYRNVDAGEQRSYKISLLSEEGIPVYEHQIYFTVVGFGIVTINVTNAIPCRGCDKKINSINIIDRCGQCLPPTDPQVDVCVGCDGRAFSGATIDLCGVCGGDALSCVDCFNVLNGTAELDECGECEGGNQACLGCDGIVNSGAKLDNCSECNGNDSCRGCDGALYSNLTIDVCGVCGGTGLTCKEVDVPDEDPAPLVLIGVIGVVVVAILLAVIFFIIAAVLGKKKFDAYQYMHNQQMNAVGENPLYNGAGGWHDNQLG